MRLRLQETLLEMTPADFTELTDVKQRLEPFEQLWNLVSFKPCAVLTLAACQVNKYQEKYSQWYKEPVFKLDALEIEVGG